MILRFFISFLALLPLSAIASENPTWTDKDGLVWTFHPNRADFAGADIRCRKMGFRLPKTREFFNAVEDGLFDPAANEVFANQIKGFDFIWMGEKVMGISMRTAASPYGETIQDIPTHRHRVVCVTH